MAIYDVKRFYYNVLNDYLQVKQDLSDATAALSDGFVTEEVVKSIQEQLDIIEANYFRVAYIVSLLELPKEKKKKKKFKISNTKIEKYFKDIGADEESIKIENACALKSIKEQLEEVTKKDLGEN